ncbi:MAG: cob(I)yrinic acid a,c-diamide adenosyltransferase [Bacteroidota bacterium]|nr:cob(I)yrinic acid a,c-diamide adenosyltransferase [Bacteroidota bacterium]
MVKGKNIYTKTGDSGETSLAGGIRVSKNHERVEAYGTLDELNSFLGVLRDMPIDNHYRDILIQIQENIGLAEASIATAPGGKAKCNPPGPDETLILENEMDQMNFSLPDLKTFILPGGHPAVSACHVARTVCRRAERVVVSISDRDSTDNAIIIYLNRLSDYLFVLARKISQDFGVLETPWIAKH